MDHIVKIVDSSAALAQYFAGETDFCNWLITGLVFSDQKILSTVGESRQLEFGQKVHFGPANGR
jgi:hypothetical protein